MDNYGMFKKFSSDNHFVSFTKSVNSAICTEKTLKTLKRITYKNIVYGHMGQLVIKDGICYATFIQNKGSDGEEHYSESSEVVLAVFSLVSVSSDSFNPETDVTVLRIGGKGDSCAGKTADSIYKDNSMCLIGDDIYICFSFITDDKVTRMFRVIYNIPTGSWKDETELKLKYKDNLYDFTDKTINMVYSDYNVEPRALGMIELVSAWSEYNGEYFATGITSDQYNNGFDVKTADFKTIELVEVLTFNDKGSAEIGSYIYRDRLYVACRQEYSLPYMLISYYDLKEKRWGEPYMIEDGNVRPWFFEYKNELYLLNTADEHDRKFTNISRVRTLKTGIEFFDNNTPIDTVVTLGDCGSYYAVCNYEERLYFVSTRDTVSFGEICLDLKSPEEVNKRLAEFFS